MVYIAPGEMFDNMLQLMRFSVYFEGVPNTNNGNFHIEVMISAAHMLRGSCYMGTFPPRKLGKNAIWSVLMFLCILY